jgi:chromosome segregation protein
MLKSIELVGFKSFGKKTELVFGSRVAGIVGPNGSGKSNVAEGFRFVLGEQSMKSLRSKKGEDLIWGGSPAVPRGNRASVKVTFDNSNKLLDIDFPEVVVERSVFRDGVNEYLINGSQVRLKDVIRLLAGANIGGSGYQIISQGEADRILNASPRERREMIEDALGLKLYQHKKAESERKLDETQENIGRVESLRRELGPHLTFLRKQVEKIEKAKELAEELKHKLADYLAREHAYIGQEGARLKGEESAYRAELARIEEEMRQARAVLVQDTKVADPENDHTRELEETLSALRIERQDAARELGRAEGELAAAIRMVRVPTPDESPIPRQVVLAHVHAAGDSLARALDASSLEEAKTAVRGAQTALGELSARAHDVAAPIDDSAELIEEVRTKAQAATQVLELARGKERELEQRLSRMRADVQERKDAAHEAETGLLHLETNMAQVRGTLANVERMLGEIAGAREAFESEVREGIALVGSDIRQYEHAGIPDGALSEDRRMQHERRRTIERLKIKLEESGAGSGDEVVREFNTTKERDSFLARELGDLSASAEQLKKIIEELDAKIDEDFKRGLVKINDAFGTFFAELFSGGEAKLALEMPEKKVLDDEESGEETIIEDEAPIAGLTVTVQLPRKKVRGLEVLSGGERALTSIALIFAMSQVNPPPFIILDETDAALDEANSRRYAEIVKALSNRSQLILITHNRATMAAAGELYGVTMGHDGISRLLSVKLEEAERVAK